MGELNARDALIAELLADVGRLHDEIKSLPLQLQGITDSLQTQSGGFVAAAEKFRQHIELLSQRVADAAKADIRRDAAEAAADAVKNAVGEQVKAAVAHLTAAAAHLEKATARVEGDTAPRPTQKSTWEGRLWTVAIAVMSAATLYGILRFGGSLSPLRANETERRAIAAGQLMQRVLQRMTPAEKERVNQLLKEAATEPHNKEEPVHP